MKSHYEVLGVSPDADLAEVRAAYRQLIKDHHPDHGGSRDRFLRIKEAYEGITGERAPGERETDGGSVAHRERVPRDPTYQPGRAGTRADRGLTVEGEYLRLTLVALARDVALSSILAGPNVNSDATRTVAFFEAVNRSDRVLAWEGRRNTTFVGDDGFMYEGSSIVTPHEDRLPDRWSGTDVDVAPGRALDAVVIAEDLPDGVDVRRIVYTQHARDVPDGPVTDTERYLFAIDPIVERRLDEVPFDRS